MEQYRNDPVIEFPLIPFPITTETNVWDSKHLIRVSKVDEPLLCGNYRKFILFKVSTPNNPDVQRRFSEFDWLFATLQTTLPNTFIPPIPTKKKFFGRNDESVVAQRQIELSRWLNRILEIPWIASSPALNLFLTVTNRSEFQKRAKQMDLQIKEELKRGTMSMPKLKPYNDANSTDARVFVRYMSKFLKHYPACLLELERTIRRMNEQLRKLKAVYDDVGNSCRLIHKFAEVFSPLDHVTCSEALLGVQSTYTGVGVVGVDWCDEVDGDVLNDLRDYVFVVNAFASFVKAFESNSDAHTKYCRTYEENIRTRLSQRLTASGVHTERSDISQQQIEKEISCSAVGFDHSSFHRAVEDFQMSFCAFLAQCEWFYANRATEMRIILGKLCAFSRNQAFLTLCSWEQSLNLTENILPAPCVLRPLHQTTHELASLSPDVPDASNLAAIRASANGHPNNGTVGAVQTESSFVERTPTPIPQHNNNNSNNNNSNNNANSSVILAPAPPPPPQTTTTTTAPPPPPPPPPPPSAPVAPPPPSGFSVPAKPQQRSTAENDDVIPEASSLSDTSGRDALLDAIRRSSMRQLKPIQTDDHTPALTNSRMASASNADSMAALVNAINSRRNKMRGPSLKTAKDVEDNSEWDSE